MTWRMSSSRFFSTTRKAAGWPLKTFFSPGRSNRSVMVAMSPNRTTAPLAEATTTSPSNAWGLRRSSSNRISTVLSRVSTDPAGRATLWPATASARSSTLSPNWRMVEAGTSMRI